MFFSVHLSWWDAGFREQLENLMEWAQQRHSGAVAATFLCGDFNNAAGSEGYRLAAERYEDQFLRANNAGLLLADDQRIDYIFMKRAAGSRLFLAACYSPMRLWPRVRPPRVLYGI